MGSRKSEVGSGHSHGTTLLRASHFRLPRGPQLPRQLDRVVGMNYLLFRNDNSFFKTLFGEHRLEGVRLFRCFLYRTDPNLPRVRHRIDAHESSLTGRLANVLRKIVGFSGRRDVLDLESVVLDLGRAIRTSGNRDSIGREKFVGFFETVRNELRVGSRDRHRTRVRRQPDANKRLLGKIENTRINGNCGRNKK